MKQAARITVLATAIVLPVAGAVGWYADHFRTVRPAPHVYVSAGYGGYTTAPPPSKPILSTTKAAAASPTTRDPLRPLDDAYNAGRYLQAETQAQAVIQEAVKSQSVKQHTQAAFARQILAYSAARRHDLPLARQRFAAMQTAAARLPDKGLETAPPGEVAPTLEAEAAFQHAVCTGALGDKAGAEAEYVAFMKQFPDSPLLHAAMLRLEHMHGGDMTPADTAVWQQAKQTARLDQVAKDRAAALCGPECLAELLRRRGEAADVKALAQEMGTSERGTSLAALAAGAKRHGFLPQGLALTPAGLMQQKLPVIALTAPGHYVIVEQASLQQVTIWDPDGRGIGHGDRRIMPAVLWGHIWGGMTLALARSVAPLLPASVKSPAAAKSLLPVLTASR